MRTWKQGFVPAGAVLALAAGQAMSQVNCALLAADWADAARGGAVVNGAPLAVGAGASVTVVTDGGSFTGTAAAGGFFQIAVTASLGSTATVTAGTGSCTVTFTDSGPRYAQNFETLTATPAGTEVFGQDGFYNPVTASSVAFNVHPYADNPLLTAGVLQVNPSGGNNFLAGVGTAATPLTFARAQRVAPWRSSGVWTVSYDVASVRLGLAGTTPVNNIGSFSLQAYPGAATYINLYSFPTDPATGLITNPNVARTTFIAYNAASVADVSPGRTIGPAFDALPLGKWFRFSQKIDFAANRVVEASITDITAGTSTTVTLPPDVFLEGGSAGGRPSPTGFRFFGGGGAGVTSDRNGTTWDNIDIAFTPPPPPPPPPCRVDCDRNGVLDVRDFSCFQNAFALGDLALADVGSPTDCAPDGALNIADFSCFQNLFALGCP